MRHLVLAAVATCALASPALAAVIRVPRHHATVQAAVNAALPGDKVIIAPGTYNENVTVDGKNDILIRGTGLVTINGGASVALGVSNSSNVRVKGVSLISSSGFVSGAGTSSNILFAKCRMQGPVGLAFISATGSRVVACQITSTIAGVAFFGPGTYTAERCRVTSTAAGVAIAAGGETANLIRCKVTYTGVPTTSPILSTASVRLFAERCRVQTSPAGSSIFGIDLQPSAPTAQHELVRNRIEGCFIGIAGASVNNVRAFGNIVAGSAFGGLAFVGNSHSIDRNKVLLGAGTFYGIGVNNSTNTTITRNKVIGAGTGVFMSNGNGNTIAGNKLKNLTVGVTLTGNANTIGPNNKYKNVVTPISDGGVGTIILDTP